IHNPKNNQDQAHDDGRPINSPKCPRLTQCCLYLRVLHTNLFSSGIQSIVFGTLLPSSLVSSVSPVASAGWYPLNIFRQSGSTSALPTWPPNNHFQRLLRPQSAGLQRAQSK